MNDLQPVALTELIESLDMTSEELICLVDLQKGEVVYVDRIVVDDPQVWLEEIFDDEDKDEQTMLEYAVAMDHGGERFIEGPSNFDYHEYKKMRDFIDDLQDDDAAAQLRQAIRGKGAFRCFKDTAHRLHLIDRWYDYRHQTMKAFVIAWANHCKVPYKEED